MLLTSNLTPHGYWLAHWPAHLCLSVRCRHGWLQLEKGAADVLGHLHVTFAEHSRLSWSAVLQTDHAVPEGHCKGQTACPHDAAGAALGYVAHLTHHLAIYLDVPLRFPLRLGNSHSWVLHHPPASSSIRWGHGYCW